MNGAAFGRRASVFLKLFLELCLVLILIKKRSFAKVTTVLETGLSHRVYMKIHSNEMEIK